MRVFKESNDKVVGTLEALEFTDEVGDFHKYFSENVETILGLEGKPQKVLHHQTIEGKEIDYLVVDNLERVYFVEIKLGRNPENRREVISQIIDYWSRCCSYTATMELPPKAKKAIETGYVNPVIVTDRLLDDHRHVLPEVRLGENNIKIRLIEIKRWQSDEEVFVTANTINNQEPIAPPIRTPIPRKKLLSLIKDENLQSFARRLDMLLTKNGFKIRQNTKSRLGYTIGKLNRMFVFVCANPVFGDKVGDFVVTKDYNDLIEISDNLWNVSPIKRSGRLDGWEGDVYELAGKSDDERERFLKFLENVLIETKRYLGIT